MSKLKWCSFKLNNLKLTVNWFMYTVDSRWNLLFFWILDGVVKPDQSSQGQPPGRLVERSWPNMVSSWVVARPKQVQALQRNSFCIWLDARGRQDCATQTMSTTIWIQFLIPTMLGNFRESTIRSISLMKYIMNHNNKYNKIQTLAWLTESLTEGAERDSLPGSQERLCQAW